MKQKKVFNMPTKKNGPVPLNVLKKRIVRYHLKFFDKNNFWSGSWGGIFQGIPPLYETLPLQELGLGGGYRQ